MRRPEISVLVAPSQAIERVRQALGRQTLDAERFEVLELAVEPDAQRARNRALEKVRAPYVLLLDEGFVPDDDLVERHLTAHTEGSTERRAILGATRFADDVLGRPLMRLIQATATLFEPPGRNAGPLDWRHLWTSQLSLPVELLREVGGFTEADAGLTTFDDVELGHRLQAAGATIRFAPSARGQLATGLTVERFLARTVRMGRKRARLAASSGDETLLGLANEGTPETRRLSTQVTVESFHDDALALERFLETFESDYAERELPEAVLTQAATILQQLGSLGTLRGLVWEWNDQDPFDVVAKGPRPGVLTSIILVSYNALDTTRRCLEALRACADPRYPQEILFVDNGSNDGSVEYLAAQPDVHLLRNDDNLGAPRARNQALAHARGEWIVFMDNDAFVAPEWLQRLRYHGEVDAQVGCVCPLSDRACHGQQIPYDGDSDAQTLHPFARERAASHHRQGQYKLLFPSFCVLVRRAVIDAIGGFDERFSPWGFEDDDFAFRAHLAGFRTRMALDVFVRHEAYAGPKLDRHTELLQRNWRRFAEKWLPGPIPAYGELALLDEVRQQTWTRSELYIDPGAAPSASSSTIASRVASSEASPSR